MSPPKLKILMNLNQEWLLMKLIEPGQPVIGNWNKITRSQLRNHYKKVLIKMCLPGFLLNGLKWSHKNMETLYVHQWMIYLKEFLLKKLDTNWRKINISIENIWEPSSETLPGSGKSSLSRKSLLILMNHLQGCKW